MPRKESLLSSPPIRPTGNAVPRTFRPVLVVVALLVAGAVWHGSDRTSSGPAAGERLSGSGQQAAAIPLTIRVGSFNIHSGVGTDGRFDLERTAESLSGLDLIALNEVRGADLRGNADQAELLGKKLGLRWLFAPAERQWWHDHYGNALLTSLPVTHWQRIPLPCTHGKGYRNMLLLTVATGDRPLHVLTTHLDRGSDRAPQLQAVTSLFLSLAEPAILMGDLNSTTADPQLRTLCSTPGVEDVLSRNPAHDPPDRIDWIITRGLRCIGSAAWDGGASDHPLVRAELAIPPE